MYIIKSNYTISTLFNDLFIDNVQYVKQCGITWYDSSHVRFYVLSKYVLQMQCCTFTTP